MKIECPKCGSEKYSTERWPLLRCEGCLHGFDARIFCSKPTKPLLSGIHDIEWIQAQLKRWPDSEILQRWYQDELKARSKKH